MAGGDTRGEEPGPSGAAETSLELGDELAGYRIETLLGRGGMGVVYRAHDIALDRKLALKLLAPELAADERFRERFLRESRLAASLDHPAIIPIYDAGEVTGRLYIAMRLVDGTDLKWILAEEGTLAPERALALLEQVADALDAAHERGLVHRDVKPSNVLVDVRGHCYLADFGLSRRLADPGPGLGAGRSLGTVDYVAPEQIRGDDVDGRADLYSLGCLLYECLNGRPPFGGSDTAVVFAHLEQAPPGLPGLEPVFAKALAKDPDDRYQSGHELVTATREALQGGRRRGRWLLAAVAAAMVAGVAIAGALVLSRDAPGPASSAPSPQPLALAPNETNLIDPGTRDVVRRIAGGPHLHITQPATDVAFADGSAWLSLGPQNRLLGIDLATRTVTRAVKLPWTPTERIAAGGGIVWVREARNLGTEVLGIDTRSGRVVRHFDIGGTSIGIAYGFGSLWLVGGAEVLRVEPKSGRTLHRFAASASWIAVGAGAVWAASTDGSVWKLDPVGNAITAQTKLHGWLTDLAVGDGAVWVSIVGEDAVYQLSEDDLSVQKALPAGTDPERISTGGGYVWVANTAARTVSLLPEDSGEREALATDSEPTTARFRDGLVWVAASRGLTPLPPIAGPELRLSTSFKLMNVDPVSRVFPLDEQLSRATCSNLLGYPDGTQLGPELAAGMPGLSKDGRTYTFHVSPGIRFSPPSNELVTAETFRHTIERTLSKYAQGWPYAPDIVGAAAFKAGKAAHISGLTARSSTLTIRLVRPAGDFLTRLSMPVFCPVPRSTPLDPALVNGPLASTGPYYVAAVEGHRTVLQRNPNYTGTRPRQSARIVIRDDIPPDKAIALVESGQLDYLPTDFSPLLQPGGPLDRRSGPRSAEARAGKQRFFLHSQPMLDTIVFNTDRPLFRDARLRRAVGYAIDRTALARAFSDAPDGRLVPTAVPGFGAAGVYPLVPDLAKARRLAGSTPRHAVLLAACAPQALSALVRSQLARIGIAVRIVQTQECHPDDVAAAFEHADFLIGSNLQCGPCNRDPAQYFHDVLDHGSYGSPLGAGIWSEPAFKARLARASPLRGQARGVAYERLEDEFERAAPVLVYGAYQFTEYFSARVGCKHFPRASQGVDLGALCVGAE